MKIPSLPAALFLLSAGFVSAQDTEYRLWPEGNPGNWESSQEETAEERNGILRVRGVNTPTMTYFAPLKEDPVMNRAAMIICPGGGYSILAIDHEGYQVARWLNELGMHAFVLKYRLPKKESDPSKWHVPLQDAQRAISLARRLATHFGFSTGRVGIMGFSAGGHLTATTSNAYEEEFDRLYSFGSNRKARPRSTRSYSAGASEPSSHPDFAALIYPAYLVGDEDRQTLSSEAQVESRTPPTFLVHTEDDHVTALSSLYYYRELKKAGIPSELHVFPSGGHGYGLRPSDHRVAMWPTLMAGWLRDLHSR